MSMQQPSSPKKRSRFYFYTVLRILTSSCIHQSGAWLVYISTDYVFDGKNPPYSIDATPNPLNEYGATKLAGEKATLAANPSAIVLRVPSTYMLTIIDYLNAYSLVRPLGEHR